MAEIAQAIIEANIRLKSENYHSRYTPLEFSDKISSETGVNIFFKCEHAQTTGSFKFRGALNKLLKLTNDVKKKGVVAASTGNHGLGVAYAARILGIAATVYTPKDASTMKLNRIRQLGSDLVLVQGDCSIAEIQARQEANASGRTFVSPYNDYDVIAGQGTIGVELLEQCIDLDAVFISVGGGGLISGVGTYLKYRKPEIQIYGCWPENSPVMYECLKADKVVPVNELETISDATAGGLEEGSITLPICKRIIDHKVLVTESNIEKAIRLIAESERWIVEGSAGLALASLLEKKDDLYGKNVAVILCGRNILIEKFFKVMNVSI